jgi:cytosine/adenosine deaminase-related metal-dependent hydrolase
MHAIFGSERGRKHQEAWEADLDGLEASPGLITSRQVLSWATLGGAEVAGIADRTGSLTPGNKADVVIIDGSAVNVAPIIDAVGAVVCAADVSNVKTVFVDGEILKEDFKLKASLDGPRKAVEGSRDYLLSKFGVPDPGWAIAASTPVS